MRKGQSPREGEEANGEQDKPPLPAPQEKKEAKDKDHRADINPWREEL